MQFSRQEGYTVIESVIAMVIFSILMVPLFQILVILQLDNRNIDRLTAVHLAEREMEQTLMAADSVSSTYRKKFAGKPFIIKKEIGWYEGCQTVSIEILSVGKRKRLARLQSILHDL